MHPNVHCSTIYNNQDMQATSVSAHFLIGSMLSCMSFVYILDINPLSDILFANIFSHSVGGLFILLIVSFTVQKFLILIFYLFLLLFLLLEETYPINIAKTDVKEGTVYVFF